MNERWIVVRRCEGFEVMVELFYELGWGVVVVVFWEEDSGF